MVINESSLIMSNITRVDYLSKAKEFDTTPLRTLHLQSSQEYTINAFFKALSAHSAYKTLSSFRSTEVRLFSVFVLALLSLTFLITSAVMSNNPIVLQAMSPFPQNSTNQTAYPSSQRFLISQPNNEYPEPQLPYSSSVQPAYQINPSFPNSINSTNPATNSNNYTSNNPSFNLTCFEVVNNQNRTSLNNSMQTYYSFSILTAIVIVLLIVALFALILDDSRRRKLFKDLEGFELHELEFIKTNNQGEYEIRSVHQPKKFCGCLCFQGFDFSFEIEVSASMYPIKIQSKVINLEKNNFVYPPNNNNATGPTNYYAIENHEQKLFWKDVLLYNWNLNLKNLIWRIEIIYSQIIKA